MRWPSMTIWAGEKATGQLLILSQVVLSFVLPLPMIALILLFLGSWRSTLIVAISIPLSVLASLSLLSAMGHTLNVMTLGGLALAIGILVDEATITIENIHRHLELGSRLRDAILEGSREIAVPALVSALAISIVFVPVIFLVGPAKFLFTPMALAVVFAILSSYALSRTLVPVLARASRSRVSR